MRHGLYRLVSQRRGRYVRANGKSYEIAPFVLSWHQPHAALMKTEDEVVVQFPDTVIKNEDDIDTAMSYLHGTNLITASQHKSEDTANTRFSFNHEGPEVFARHADGHASIPDPPDGTPRVKIVDRIIGQLNGRRPEGADMTMIEAVFGEQPAMTLGKQGRTKWRRRVHFLFLSDFAHFHGRAQDGRTEKVENDIKSPGTYEVPHTVMDSVNILRSSNTRPGDEGSLQIGSREDKTPKMTPKESSERRPKTIKTWENCMVSPLFQPHLQALLCRWSNRDFTCQ
jgi:hypothetical protein